MIGKIERVKLRDVWKHEANRKRPVFASHSIDLDVFPDPHILGILEHHHERETGLLSFFERLKICDVDVWT